MSKTPNLIGQKFGRLLVIQKASPSKSRGPRWLCKCDCGAFRIVSAYNLKTGKTQSCGCLHKEQVAHLNKKHGEFKTRLYRIWAGVVDRCENSKKPAYENYGGRGIVVCDEWRKSYEAFRDWALVTGYADNLTIERINNDGNYEPNNCRWATRKEQARNRRRTHLILGKSLAQWAEETGIHRGTIRSRIVDFGWSPEDAVSTPAKPRTKKNDVRGAMAKSACNPANQEQPE